MGYGDVNYAAAQPYSPPTTTVTTVGAGHVKCSRIRHIKCGSNITASNTTTSDIHHEEEFCLLESLFQTNQQ